MAAVAAVIVLLVGGVLGANPVVLNTSIADPHIHIFNGKAYMYAGRDLSPNSTGFEMPVSESASIYVHAYVTPIDACCALIKHATSIHACLASVLFVQQPHIPGCNAMARLSFALGDTRACICSDDVGQSVTRCTLKPA
jgi:hypothetical protein